MARETEVGAAAELVPGVVRGAGRYAVGNANGELFAVTRRCRHLGADLADGSVDRRVAWSVLGMAPDTTWPPGG